MCTYRRGIDNKFTDTITIVVEHEGFPLATTIAVRFFHIKEDIRMDIITIFGKDRLATLDNLQGREGEAALCL